ncbi:MAG: DNA-processing protein DprA [Eubacteriales bacterium]
MGKYEYWFASINKLSHKKKRMLIEKIKDIESIYHIEKIKQNPFLGLTDREIHVIEQAKENWDIEGAYEKAIRQGIKVVTWEENAYPRRLRPYQDAPYALFYKGELPAEEIKTVSIVGARRCSPYGEKYAVEYSKLLVDCGVQVISGMARGIDGLAQRTAIDEGGKSFGVLGCGVDICYPRENIGLYRDLSMKGGIISEQPIGIQPIPANFPLRNRIISGLSDVILIIEAKERSGSLITADLALEQGKEVYALPGMVSSELSRGCNELIKQGAGLLNNAEEFMEDIGICIQNKSRNFKENKIMLETKEKLVYSCLCLEAKHIDCILEQTKVPIHELMNILITLELKGYIQEKSKNYYVISTGNRVGV